MLIADPRLRRADRLGDARDRIRDGEDRVLVREVEDPRVPSALAFEQGGDDAEAQVEAADEVRERAARPHRRPVREARHRQQPARRLGDDVVGRLAGPRARVSEAR